MQEKLKNLPNSITVMRMVGTVFLLFTKPMSLCFYIVYTITGLTDVLDGFFARKLKVSSDFGAKLDSIADLLFYSVMIILLIPVLWEKLHKSIWVAVVLILGLRLTAYLLSAIKYKKFASSHSILNKITGLCVFAIPFVLLTPFPSIICWIIAVIGFFSSFDEMMMYIKN